MNLGINEDLERINPLCYALHDPPNLYLTIKKKTSAQTTLSH